MKIFIVWIAVASLTCGCTATRVSAASLRNAKQGSITGDAGRDHKAYPEMPVPKAFPFPQNIAPARCPTGNYHVGCFYDTQLAHRRWYDEEVPKEDRLPMTPDLCYAFCSKVSGVQYFGVTRGDRCYCTPFFHNTGMNAHGDCDMPCVGDQSRMCGGMERSDVYVLHDCKNLPDLPCKKSPQPPLHAKMFNSTYYRTGTPCSNAKREPLTTLETFCDIECEAGFFLAKNEIRCVRKGDPLGYSWAQVLGQAVCQSISCGKPPDFPHTTHAGAPALYGVAVEYSCQLGYSMDGTAKGQKDFSLVCGKDGTFNTTKDLGCQIVSCGKCPEGGKKYKNSTVSEKKTRYYGDECSYKCDEGFTLNGQPDGKKTQQMACLPTGEFAEPKMCEAVTCGVASPVPNAKLLTKDAVKYPGSAEYEVNEGYTMTGKPEPPGYKFTRKCTAEGSFTDIIPPLAWVAPVSVSIQSVEVEPEPVIDPVPCGKPPDVENAMSPSKNLTFGQTATYSCLLGFTLTGKSDGDETAELVCSATGTYLWQGKESPMPKCLPVECGAAPKRENAKLVTELDSDVVTTASPQLVYECNPGYSTSKVDDPFGPTKNKTSITCQGTGEFTKADECVDIKDCSPTHCGDYGKCVEVDPPTATPFDNYNCKCEAGYMQVIEKMAPPAVDKKVCEDINDCPTPIEDSCGGKNRRGRKRGRCIDGLMTYTCRPSRGYRVETKGGNETCVPNECGAVPSVKNGKSDIEGEANYDTPKWNYTCNEGYSLTGEFGGPTTFGCRCLARGQFSKLQKCVPVSCGSPPSIENTIKSPNVEVLEYPKKILYTADKGYSLDGKKNGEKTFEVECKANGEQVGEKTVKPVECGKVPKQENATYDADTVLVFGDSTTVKCDKGHSIDKTPLPSSLSYEITCEADGELNIPDVCQYITIPLEDHEIDCGTAPKVDHSTVEGSTLFGKKLTYTAVEGYSLDGSSKKSQKTFEVRCKPTEVFTATRKFQRISCGPSRDVPNSQSAEFIEFAGGSFVQSAHVFSRSLSKTMASRQDKSYDMLFGDAVKYTCMEGHKIGRPSRAFVGNRNPDTLTLTCDGQGQIVPTKPKNPREIKCLPVSCGIPTGKKCKNCDADLVDLEKDGTPFISFEEKQQFVCDEGFSLDGKPSGEQDFSETCQANGRLTRKNKCQDIDWCLLSKCGGPEKGECVDGDLGYTCMCKPGFKNVTTGIHTTCEQIDECETLKGHKFCAGKGGDYGTCTDKKLHYVCNCEKGYEAKKMRRGRRQQYCNPVKCPSIEARENSDPEKEGKKMHYKDTETYTCKPGYSLDGNKDGKKSYTVKCLSDGTLSKVDDCKPVACECVGGSCVPEVKNGAAKGSFDKALVFGESAQFECEKGFTTSGDAAGLTEFSVTCTAAGALTEPQKCLPVECGFPPKIANSVISESKDLVYKDVVTVTCDKGYTTTGKVDGSVKFDFECLASGKLDGVGPSCAPVSCGKPPDIEHSEFNSRELFYTDEVRVLCHSGFSVDSDPNGESSFVGTCEADGKLDGMGECKPVSCGKPGDEEGAVSKNPETFYNETATWTCKPGYSTDGLPGGDDEFTRPCNAHGKFTKSSPDECKDVDFCTGSPCTSNGICTDLGVGKVKPGYSCECADGYQIKKKADGSETCSEDDCAGNPCGAGGTCTDLSKLAEKEGLYSCDCDLGYEMVEPEKDKPTCIRLKCGSMQTDIKNILREGGAPKVTIVTWDKNVSDKDENGVAIMKAGDSVKYTCAKGYSTDGMATQESYDFTVRCENSGLFSPILTGDSECMKIKCDNYQRPMVKFAKILQDNEHFFEYGDVLDFECDPGYTITGQVGGASSFSISCTAEGVFTKVHEDCLPVTCSVPEGVNSVSSVGSGDLQYPKPVTYTCLSGYLANGKSTYAGKCGAKGKIEFEGESECEPVECGTPEPQANADLLVTSGSVFLTSLNKSHSSSGNLFKRASPQRRQRMALVGESTHEHSDPPLVPLSEGFVMTTVHAPVVVKCHSGYTVGGLSGAVTSYALECMNSGKIVAMNGNKVESSKCEQPGFQVSGIVTDAQSAAITLSGTHIKFTRDGDLISQSESKYSGKYTATLPAGTYSVEATKDGYITYEGDLTVVSSISTGGAGDLALSQVLPEGEWRVTLQWAEKSKDLDSWTFMGENAKEKVYYVDKSIKDDDTGIEAILDRDDVSGYGPETTTFKGIGTCVKKSNCLLKFYVDNYTPESKDMGDSKAKITLYKGSRTVKEYEIPTSAGAARQWPIFTLDASQGAAQEVFDGDMVFGDDGDLIPNPKPYGSGGDDEYTYYYDDDYFFLEQIDGTAW